MKPDDIQAAWERFRAFQDVQVGGLSDEDAIRDLIARSGEVATEVAEGLAVLRRSLGLSDDVMSAFHKGVDAQRPGVLLGDEETAQMFDTIYSAGAVAGLIVGRLAAREAGEVAEA